MTTLLLEYRPLPEKKPVFSRKPTPYANKPEIEIIKMIKDGKLNPKNLKFEERMAVVAVLRYSGLKNFEIGEVLKCSSRTIDRYIHQIKERDTCLVRHVTVEKVAGNLIRLAEQLKAKAIKDGNTSLAWTIECQLIDKLQSLGFIYKKPEQSETKLTGELKVNVDDVTERKELQDEYRRFLTKN